MPAAMRTVFMGTPDVVLPVLEALLEGGYQVVGVYTQPDKPSGRGRQVSPSVVKRRALEKGIPVFQPFSFRSPEAVEELAALKPELVVVAAYGKILPRSVLAIPERGCINVHPSLLPGHRGPSPVATAILEGDRVTGVTIILMDEGMDSGPILAQREAPIDPEDAAGTLTRRLFLIGAQFLVETLERWFHGEIQLVAQDHAKATFTRFLEREDGYLDFSRPAEVLRRQVQACQPWPGAYTTWQGKTLKLLEVVALKEVAEGSGSGQGPGLVVSLSRADAGIAVMTGDGMLGVKRLQMEGKRAVSGEEFLRGHRQFIGSRLPS
ncbi:MAG: methionyl-tRNA formyltransferase [Chloroflexi bacterium]|nr:methionyl-tRNA formyltransferase [Chloroflexota bacterium]